jgi:galactose mutarotase-like enzyme
MKNAFLDVRINDKGAELSSIKDTKTGFEFLWQADPAIWARHAPVLFPVVGKVAGNELKVKGKAYPLTQHGFARDMTFKNITETQDEVWYSLTSDAHTLTMYPYAFELAIGYRIDGRSLTCTYRIIHTGNSPMYFSIGAHPGFNLPNAKLEDYMIIFEHEEQEERHLLQNGLFSGETKPVFSTPRTINLSAALFDDDAIVLKNLRSTQLKLKQRNGTFCITLDYQNFPYMGLWAPKGSNRFICLEPWCGHSDPVNGHTDISAKPGIISLAEGELFTRSYTLTFEV